MNPPSHRLVPLAVAVVLHAAIAVAAPRERARRSESAVTKGLPSRSPPIHDPGRTKLGGRSPSDRSQRA